MASSTEYTNATRWAALLAHQDDASLLEDLQDAPLIEVAEFIAQQPLPASIALFRQLPETLQGDIFAEFEEEHRALIYHQLSKKDFSSLFGHIPSHERADFYQQLGEKEQVRLLPYLPKNVRKDVITLSAYPPETAGGIMSTDFATVVSDMTVKQATQKLREDSPSKKMIYYIYVVDKNMKMMGFVSLKDLIMSSPNKRVSSLLHENFVHAGVYDDREEVAQRIEKYDLVAIPILNEEEQLVGIVCYDDAMDVIRAEATEDMEKFMGIVSDEDTSDYLKASSWQHFRKRVFWITGLFIASFLSEVIIHHHESLLAQFTILALYLPMIAGAGGNAGSQAATVVIRAISLNQVTLRNWMQIILKEAQIAILLASCLFIVAFMKVVILSGSSQLSGHSIYSLAFAISLALSLQVITSTVVGATLPLIAKYFKGDPAVAASPAITTFVDITGMAIYFSIAIMMLN